MLRRLFTKSLLYFTALAAGKVLSAVYFMFLARALLPEKFGQIMLFVTLIQVITTLSDIGVKNWYLKVTADNDDPSLLGALFVWRQLLFVVTVVIVIAIQVFYPLVSAELLGVLLISCWFESLVTIADAHYLARGKSLWLGLKLIVRNVLLFASLAVIRTPEDVGWFYLAYIVTWVLVLAVYFPFKRGRRSLVSWWRSGRHLPSLRSTLPYAAIDDLGVIYSRADQLLINSLLDSAALGIYAAAYRFLDAFNLLPQALFHNLFPLAAKKGGLTRRQIGKMVLVMTTLGLLVAVGLVFGSGWLINLVLGPEYAGAAAVLRLFGIVIVMFFFNAPLNTVLQSCDQVRHYVPFLAGSTLVNLVLNYLLIPRFGVSGSAYAMIAGEGLLVIINVWLVSRFTRPERRDRCLKNV